MLPLLRFAQADLARERPSGADEDVHFLEELVALVLEELRLSVMRYWIPPPAMGRRWSLPSGWAGVL